MLFQLLVIAAAQQQCLNALNFVPPSTGFPLASATETLCAQEAIPLASRHRAALPALRRHHSLSTGLIL